MKKLIIITLILLCLPNVMSMSADYLCKSAFVPCIYDGECVDDYVCITDDSKPELIDICEAKYDVGMNIARRSQKKGFCAKLYVDIMSPDGEYISSKIVPSATPVIDEKFMYEYLNLTEEPVVTPIVVAPVVNNTCETINSTCEPVTITKIKTSKMFIVGFILLLLINLGLMYKHIKLGEDFKELEDSYKDLEKNRLQRKTEINSMYGHESVRQ